MTVYRDKAQNEERVCECGRRVIDANKTAFNVLDCLDGRSVYAVDDPHRCGLPPKRAYAHTPGILDAEGRKQWEAARAQRIAEIEAIKRKNSKKQAFSIADEERD